MTSPFWGGPLLGLVVLTPLVALPIKIGETLAWALRYLLAIRAMLGTSFLGAVGVAIVATVVSVGTFLVLMHLGWMLATPPAGSVYL